MSIGVIEGFFGPAWPKQSRLGYAKFLNNCGADFFLYAPKQDQHLRKLWRQSWPQEYINELSEMAQAFHHEGVSFGVGISPFGYSLNDKEALIEKLKLLGDLKIDSIGVFFDDMPVSSDLAANQLEALKVVRGAFRGEIIFCPSFYSYDPILDKVFGQRPADYLETVAGQADASIEIAWTGPKVISPTIDSEHLSEVTQLLRRKPFIWENIFANDGPKNCKYLKLKSYSGRASDILSSSTAVAFNMMNQPELSKIVFLASIYVLRDNTHPEVAFEKALKELCSERLGEFIRINLSDLKDKGLDTISSELKSSWIEFLNATPEPMASEIQTWLKGGYEVGAECLTD